MSEPARKRGKSDSDDSSFISPHDVVNKGGDGGSESCV